MQSSLAKLLGLRGDVRLDFVVSRGPRRQCARRSGAAAGSRLSAAEYDTLDRGAIRCSTFCTAIPATLPRCSASRPWEAQRCPVDRPADPSRGRCRPRSWRSSTASRAWADRSTSTRSITATMRPTPSATSSATSIDTIGRSRAEGGRAVLGKSSGGFGAMHLVMEHPGVFAAFASHSGDSYFSVRASAGVSHVQRTLERHGGDVAAFVDRLREQHKRTQSEYSTMEMLGYASAYSPRSGRAFDLDLPFDPRTGELDEAVFARWLGFDPAERVAGRVSRTRAAAVALPGLRTP